MVQIESRPERAEESAAARLIPPEFALMGQKGIEEFTKAQAELFEKFQDANQKWLDRLLAEATVLSEFSTKLTTARSIPDAATAYQDLATRHMEMAGEDAKRLLADSQAFMETGARILSGGWRPNGQGASS